MIINILKSTITVSLITSFFYSFENYEKNSNFPDLNFKDKRTLSKIRGGI
jgi:hypothetical protein